MFLSRFFSHKKKEFRFCLYIVDLDCDSNDNENEHIFGHTGSIKAYKCLELPELKQKIKVAWSMCPCYTQILSKDDFYKSITKNIKAFPSLSDKDLLSLINDDNEYVWESDLISIRNYLKERKV